MVHRGSLDRFFAQRSAQASGTERESEIRRLPELLRSQADAGKQARGNPVALCRRIAHRRGDASFSDARSRLVWRGVTKPERRSAVSRSALEVRIEKHQVDRQNQ